MTVQDFNNYLKHKLQKGFRAIYCNIWNQSFKSSKVFCATEL